MREHLPYRSARSTTSRDVIVSSDGSKGVVCRVWGDSSQPPVIWQMTETTAPRTLTHLPHMLVPIMREQWLDEVAAVVRQGKRRFTNTRSSWLQLQQVYEARTHFLLEFLLLAKIPGAEDERLTDEFLDRFQGSTYSRSMEFLKHLVGPEDQYVHPNTAAAQSKADLASLRVFLNDLDPSGGLVEQFRERVKTKTDVELMRERGKLIHKPQAIYKNNEKKADQESDLLGIGIWSTL